MVSQLRYQLWCPFFACVRLKLPTEEGKILAAYRLQVCIIKRSSPDGSMWDLDWSGDMDHWPEAVRRRYLIFIFIFFMKGEIAYF